MRTGLLLLALVAFAGASWAQAPPPPSAEGETVDRPPPPPAAPIQKQTAPPPPSEAVRLDVPAATDTLSPAAAPADVLDRYRADPDFHYDRPRAERPSLWSRILDWIARELLEPLGRAASTQAGEWVLIGLLILLLGWGVTRLLRADVGPLFARRDVATAATGPLLDVDDISVVDLRSHLDDALRESRYRDAVRFRYLLALQALDARHALRWGRHKTNREYVREVREAAGAGLADPFAEVTRVFDFAWYGERPVDRGRFERLAPLFEGLDAALATAPRQSVET